MSHRCPDCGEEIEAPYHACLTPEVAAAYIYELRYQLRETGDALLREDKRTREARQRAQDECVEAILNGSQFFLAGIEPEMREAVIRRALNLD